MNLPTMAQIKPSVAVRPFSNSLYSEKETLKDNHDYTSKNINSVFNYFTKLKGDFLDKFRKIRTIRMSRGAWASCKLWILAIFVYCMFVLASEGDPDELLTEEDHVSLREWVKEVSL